MLLRAFAENAAISSARVFVATSVCLNLLLQSAAADPTRTPLQFAATYTGELLSNQSGGITRDTAYVDNLDLTLSVDADALFGWQDSEFFVYGLYNNGSTLSETIVGDAQVVSNIETGVEATRLFEAWIRTPLGDATELKFGLQDLNSAFDVLESAQLFAGSAHGLGTDLAQTGRNGPSTFPVTGLGLKVTHELSEQWTLRGAIFDGVPGDPLDLQSSEIRLGGGDGALLIAELEWSNQASRVLSGAWGYTREAPVGAAVSSDLTDASSRNYGLYLRGETAPFRSMPDVSVFGRVGYARSDVNEFEYFIGSGLTWRGNLLRDGDQLGIAFAWAETSGYIEQLAVQAGAEVDAREVSVELTYRVPFGERVALQPTLYHVMNPGIDPSVKDALVVALRFEVGLLR